MRFFEWEEGRLEKDKLPCTGDIFEFGGIVDVDLDVPQQTGILTIRRLKVPDNHPLFRVFPVVYEEEDPEVVERWDLASIIRVVIKSYPFYNHSAARNTSDGSEIVVPTCFIRI
jgi:hypothetical protein